MLRGGSAALEAAAVAVAGKRLVTRLHPHVTDGLGIIVGGMVVSRNMFADHVPDKQLAQVRQCVDMFLCVWGSACCLELKACGHRMLLRVLADVLCARCLHPRVLPALCASWSLTALLTVVLLCPLPCRFLLLPFSFSPQLKRLVRYLRRQQALGRALPEGITPVVLAAPPAQQGIPPRTRM
jgi:hypothetical protein